MNWNPTTTFQDLSIDIAAHRREFCSMVSHNKLEGKEPAAGKVQRGGTVTILRGELTAYVKDSGVDPSGLGRWSWYLLQGKEGFSTRVITAYTPCGSAASRKKT